MDEADVRSLYDSAYAAVYDERFLEHEPWAAHGAAAELQILGELLGGGGGRTWLDVACGTGWFLSRFPEIERAGLDLSPAMLERAASANPGVPLTEGSFLHPHPEWTDRWSVVSCMWFAYGYVDTVAQVQEVIANLARWTAPDGVCFVPVCDLEDLAGGVQVPYLNPDTWVFGGPLRITAFVWGWADDTHGKDHRQLVCPHLDHMVMTLGTWFEHVEVVSYPPFQPGWGSRRAIIGHRKRPVPGAGPAAGVTRRHLPGAASAVDPAPADASPREPPAGQPAQASVVRRIWWRLPAPVRLKVKAALPRSLGRRLGSGDQAPPE